MVWLDWLLGFDHGGLDAADASFALKHAPALWLVILVIVPATAAFSWWLYRREAGATAPRARAALAVVRAVLLLWILLLLCEPVLFIERARQRKSTVAVLVDQSQSMSIRDKIVDPEERAKIGRVTGLHDDPRPMPDAVSALLDGSSRIELVNRVLTNPSLGLLKALAERNEVKLYGFDSRLAADVKEGAFEAKGNLTGLGDAIKYAVNDLRGQALAAIVIFSDGRSNTGDDPLQVARMARDRRIPLFTVSPGVPQVLRDVELSRLEAPDTVLARDAVTLTFRVKTLGFENQPVRIELLEREKGEERVSGSQDLTVDAAKAPEQTVTMQYRPQKPGEVELVIQTSPLVLPGELTGENNRLTHPLKIVDNKIKVLFVDGYPRWDYRYLKTGLVRDDTVEADVLLVSSDPDFPQEGTKGRTPLTEFPGDRKALFEYDVILLGDVHPNDLGSGSVPRDEALKNLIDFVTEVGGGICFQAGPRADPQAWRDTPLAALLPVELEDDAQEVISGEAFRLQLTPEGREHPILRLDGDPARNLKLFEDPKEGLPGFFWFAPVRRAKPGATVLAVHPTQEHERYGKRPIVSVQPYGRGRTMFVGIDETFRWRYIVGDLYFYRFWRQGLTWLRQGRLQGSKRFQVELDKPRYAIGDRVRIAARVFDPLYRPLEDPSVEALLETPRGDRERIRLTLLPGKPGQYEGSYSPTEPRDPTDPAKTGLHRVSIGPEDEEKDRAFAQFLCVVPNREFDDPTIDAKTLYAMATASEGQFFNLHEVGNLPSKVRTVRSPAAVDAREEDLGDAPLAFLLFALLITIEWVARKVLRMI